MLYAVDKSNVYMATKRGVRRLWQNTIGWRFLCNWRDSSSNWASIKVVKESNPVEVGEYVTAFDIEDEPVLAWWVPYTLKKRDKIIASINSR